MKSPQSALPPGGTLAGYIVALRTGTVAFFIASAASADIAALRKAPKSSPIAQGIVIEVKGTFMIVEGVVLGLIVWLVCSVGRRKYEYKSASKPKSTGGEKETTLPVPRWYYTEPEKKPSKPLCPDTPTRRSLKRHLYEG